MGSPDASTESDVEVARAAATAAMLRVRDAAGQVLATISDAQPVAPHHLLALRAVAEGAVTPSDVAATTGRHASSVSRVIDQLVAEQLLERSPHPQDRRQVLLRLTGDGRGVVKQFETLDRSFAMRLMDDFDVGEAQELAGYLDRIAAAATALASELEDDPSVLDEHR